MCQIAVASGKCCYSSEAGSYSSAYVLGFVCTCVCLPDVMNQMLVWYLAIGMMPVGIFYQRTLFSYK